MTVAPTPRRRRSLVVSLVLILVIAFGSLTATLISGWSPKLGLDLAGGTELVLVPQKGGISASQQNEAVAIIQNRVNGLGVSGATVQTQGSQIVVQIPGVDNGRTLDNELVTLAQLYFRPVVCFAPPYVKPTGKEKPKSPFGIPACESQYQLTEANIGVQVQPNTVNGYSANNVPAFPPYASYPSITTPVTEHGKPAVIYQDNPKDALILDGAPGTGTNERYYVGPAVLSGTVIASATAQQGSTGAWEVSCALTSKGSGEWDSVSQEFFHQYIAFELDGVVQSAALILPEQSTWSSFDGGVTISGDFTQGQANSLAIALQYGSLPVALKILDSESVSPTLGHSALIAGLGAGLAGLILVLLYVIGYYRMLGLVVITGLGVTAAILWALISALGRTSAAPSFDLAGVTGIIVSIGITVDSYIVYFERLKDETRAGRSVRTSLERGFASAWRTVLAADTVSFLAALLLYFLAVGSVQGFAFFLGLSTLLDVIVTWFFTRPAVALLGRNEALTSMRRLGVARGLAVSSGAPA